MDKPYYSGALVWSYLASFTFSSWRLDFDFLQPSQVLKISSHFSNLNLSFDQYQLSTYARAGVDYYAHISPALAIFNMTCRRLLTNAPRYSTYPRHWN